MRKELEVLAKEIPKTGKVPIDAHSVVRILNQ